MGFRLHKSCLILVLGVLVGAVPEEALCDFVKMAFTDPS